LKILEFAEYSCGNLICRLQCRAALSGIMREAPKGRHINSAGCKPGAQKNDSQNPAGLPAGRQG